MGDPKLDKMNAMQHRLAMRGRSKSYPPANPKRAPEPATNAAALPQPANLPVAPGQNKSGGCFIATAAYGSAMADDVRYLRAFRDQYLLTNELGRRFVSYYYRWSPPLAEGLRSHENWRALVRLGLAPWALLSKWVVSADVLAAETSGAP